MVTAAGQPPATERNGAPQQVVETPSVEHKRIRRFRALFELASFLLAILAILFAAVQFLDSRRLKTEMTHVAQSMSTEYIAEFPDNMEEINRVVSSAKRELDIMVDVPGYGQYSRPEISDLYMQALRKLRPDVTIKMLIYDENSVRESRRRQFAGREFSDLMKNKRFKHYFHDVWPTLGEPNSKEEFMDKLQQKQRDYEKSLLEKQIDIKHVSGRLMFYLWLADNQEAIFSFQNNSKEEHEISFRTRDGTLINTFKNTFDQTWSSANSSVAVPIS